MPSTPPSDPGAQPAPAWLDAALRCAANLLDRALIVLRPDTRMVWCNRAGRALLAAPGAPWWLDPEGRLHPRGTEAALAWRQALRAASAAPGGWVLQETSQALPPGRLTALTPHESHDAAPLHDTWLLLLPQAGGPAAAATGADPISAVSASAPSGGATPSTATLPILADYARLFGLDAAEAHLLGPLACRVPLATLADTLHLSPGTLRGRVRRICRKTHLSGLPALRRELAALPPLLGG